MRTKLHKIIDSDPSLSINKVAIESGLVYQTAFNVIVGKQTPNLRTAKIILMTLNHLRPDKPVNPDELWNWNSLVCDHEDCIGMECVYCAKDFS